MKYLRVETEDYDLLVKKDPAHIQMDLCQWMSNAKQPRTNIIYRYRLVPCF